MPKLRKLNGRYLVEGVDIRATDDMYLDCDTRNYLNVDVKVVDERKISPEQRKFIFALCNDISYDLGDDAEYYRLLMQQFNANLRGIKVESLSNCTMVYANGLIDTIIDWCIQNDIALDGQTLGKYKYKFNERQTYMMCLKRVCVICGKRADIHHVDHIGTRMKRSDSHEGLRVLPLCRIHHNLIHAKGEQKVIDAYHLNPVVVDKKMDYFIHKGKLKVFDDGRMD